MERGLDSSALRPDGRVLDAGEENWVDDHAPAWARPYLRLSRADRPIGTWLLLIPCFWGIALAINATGFRWIDLWLFPACTLGAFLMRGAGCTWNDIQDRDIDASVARTRSRPIPSGQVTVEMATLWMVTQALVAFLILLTFNWAAFILGILALGPVAVYPFAKRFTWWPQVFLGIAFNWGALMMWAAHTGGLELAPIYLYLAGIAWTLHYDTIYAHQDREDDALIGVKSTARLFDTDTKEWLWLFTGITFIFAVCASLFASGGWFGLIGAVLLAGHMALQIRELDIDDPARCLELFKSNRWAGLAYFVGLMLDAVL